MLIKSEFQLRSFFDTHGQVDRFVCRYVKTNLLLKAISIMPPMRVRIHEVHGKVVINKVKRDGVLVAKFVPLNLVQSERTLWSKYQIDAKNEVQFLNVFKTYEECVDKWNDIMDERVVASKKEIELINHEVIKIQSRKILLK